ncbi:hypothetical protein GPX89_26575 [Nocardia sp. ET3-3]|uniref:Acyl-CoA dehydrogenase n=1 Tax=Nocardia terrae TaxID=2675851 RepID=A0A7K1V2E4_9NOCA|nr:acyl-CoA dehydrogenase family protein [Nocardia terrae]MVU80806.1 hypothetical protein [Nocardia terrae]
MSETELATARRVFDDEHEAFRDSFAVFVKREVVPAPSAAAMFAAAGRNGFLGIQVPEELGGAAVPDPRFGLVGAEELARNGLLGLGLSFATHVGVAIPALLDDSTDEQQARWLPDLVSGERIAAVGGNTVRFSAQPGGGRLDGVVLGVVNAASAGLLLIPVAGPDGDPRVAVLDPRAPGVRICNEIEPMGLSDAGLFDIHLDGVEVDEQDLVHGNLMRIQRDQRLWSAVLAVAGARTALDWALDYVRGRKVFGRTVASFENTRYALAALLAEIVRTESLVDSCVRDHCAGRLAPYRAAALALSAGELLCRAADQALQLHGGYGYMREYPISQAFADARYFRLASCSSESVTAILAAELGL